MVEAVRVGTIFGQDQKQYERWKRRQSRRRDSAGDALTGGGLELHVAALAFARPDLVKRVSA